MLKHFALQFIGIMVRWLIAYEADEISKLHFSSIVHSTHEIQDYLRLICYLNGNAVVLAEVKIFH